MKKIFYVLIAVVILMLATPHESFAAFVPFNEFKIVGNSRDTNWYGPTSAGLPVFQLNQTPYLYVQLPTDYIFAQIDTKWKSPAGASFPTSQYQVFWDGDQAWISLSNWNSVKKPGTWTVDGSYMAFLCKHGKQTASFVVTPEPMAFILYGIGGLPLMAHFVRRRKTMAV